MIMAYKRSVYQRAKEILDEKKRNAEAEAEYRRSEVMMKCPELLEIEREMAQCGADVVKAVGMGGDVAEYVRNLAIKNLAAQDKRKALLKKAGFPENYLDVKYNCIVCKDTGSHDGYYCPCYKKLIRDVARDDLDANSPIKKCTFDNFLANYYPDVKDSLLGVNQREHMVNTLNFCRAYAEDFSLSSKGIIMIGKTGLGKTHLSLAIANRVLEKGYDVYYDSIQTIMYRLEKEHFGRLSPDESIKDDVLNCDLLIIDDLGVEFTTQFTISELHNIINTRMLRSLPTIISTNLELSELEEKYTQRIASRIMGSCYPLRFCGKDIRQMK